MASTAAPAKLACAVLRVHQNIKRAREDAGHDDYDLKHFCRRDAAYVFDGLSGAYPVEELATWAAADPLRNTRWSELFGENENQRKFASQGALEAAFENVDGDYAVAICQLGQGIGMFHALLIICDKTAPEGNRYSLVQSWVNNFSMDDWISGSAPQNTADWWDDNPRTPAIETHSDLFNDWRSRCGMGAGLSLSTIMDSLKREVVQIFAESVTMGMAYGVDVSEKEFFGEHFFAVVQPISAKSIAAELKSEFA